jgi:hypothetical protein
MEEPGVVDLPQSVHDDVYKLLGLVKQGSTLIALGCVLLAAVRGVMAWRSGSASEFGKMGWIAIGGVIIGSAGSLTGEIFHW